MVKEVWALEKSHIISLCKVDLEKAHCVFRLAFEIIGTVSFTAYQVCN